MSKSKVKWTSDSHIPKYKNLPRCNFRTIHGNIWTRLIHDGLGFSGHCGNQVKVPNCSLRIPRGDFQGYCKLAKCLLDETCGCCFWCPFTYKERLKDVFQKR